MIAMRSAVAPRAILRNVGIGALLLLVVGLLPACPPTGGGGGGALSALSVSETEHDFGAQLEDWTLEIWNSGDPGTILGASLSKTENWILLSRTAGTSRGPDDRIEVTVSVDERFLDTGTNTGTIRILGAGRIQAITVTAVEGESVEIDAVADAVLYEDVQGRFANGGGDFLIVGRTPENQLRRSLIRFDLEDADLPNNAEIVGARLRLRVSDNSPVESRLLTLHYVQRAWSEGDADPSGNESNGVAAVNGDATWLHRQFPSLRWNAPGGDFDEVASADVAAGDENNEIVFVSQQLVADVQAWVDAPNQNFGWLIAGVEGEDDTIKRLDSRESSRQQTRPVLEIDYVAP